MTYWIDRRNSYKERRRHSNFIFDLFGAFSNETGVEVRRDILNRINMERELYASVGHIVLAMRGCDLDTWCEEMSDENQFPDELLIYTLSHTYNHHTLVMCKNQYWSTVESNDVLSEAELFKACHVHLIYLGNGVFGELKQRPFDSSTPHPSVAEHDAMALQKICGKGRPCAKSLDLSRTVSVTMSSNVEPNMKGGNETNSNIIEIVPSSQAESVYNDAADSVDNVSELLVPVASDQNNVVDDTPEPNPVPSDAESIQTNTPLIVIPPEFWLIQPHEVDDDSTVKGRNDNDYQVDSVTENNVKGGNSTGVQHDESGGSKETIMSRVEDKVEDMFITEAENNKCVVPLERLSDRMIKTFQPSRRTPEIDPYSSLEDVGSDISEKPDAQPTPEPIKWKSVQYFMRERKRKITRHSTKPLRTNRTQTDYSKLFSLSSDSDPDPKPPKPKKPHVMSEPSKDRIAAQEKIDSKGKPKHKPAKPDIGRARKWHFFRKDPSLHPPPHRKKYATDNNKQAPASDTDDIYGGETEVDEPLKSDPPSDASVPVDSPVNRKGKFRTRSHGLPKK